MIDIQKILREAADKDKVDPYLNEFWTLTTKELERAFALYREAVVQELVAGSGEPVAYRTEDSTNGVNVWLFKKTAVKYQDPPDALYTADQLAGAVARERERCAKLVADLSDMRVPASEYAASIRSGE